MIYGDNQEPLVLSRDPICSERTKNIDVRYHPVRDQVENNDVHLKYLPNCQIVADVMTNELPTTSHKLHSRNISLRNNTVM